MFTIKSVSFYRMIIFSTFAGVLDKEDGRSRPALLAVLFRRRYPTLLAIQLGLDVKRLNYPLFMKDAPVHHFSFAFFSRFAQGTRRKGDTQLLLFESQAEGGGVGCTR